VKIKNETQPMFWVVRNHGVVEGIGSLVLGVWGLELNNRFVKQQRLREGDGNLLDHNAPIILQISKSRYIKIAISRYSTALA
jgi:hypothetical protein